MKTRVVETILIGEQQPRYFVDYNLGSHWKNSGSFKSKNDALRHCLQLEDANVITPNSSPS